MSIRRFEEREYDSLTSTRELLRITQSDMAARMGLGLRAYQEMEADPAKAKIRHLKLASLAALDVALEKSEPMLAPPPIRRKALDLAALIRGQG